MAQVGRLAGALLAHTADRYYLIGNPKLPCDWATQGFEPDGDGPAILPFELGDSEPRDQPEPRSKRITGPRDGDGPAILSFELGDEHPSGGPPPIARLRPLRPVSIAAPRLDLSLEGDPLARLLARAFVIERTGSVSERLWRLVIGESDERACPPGAVIDAQWLVAMPAPIWAIVRDSVLRCS